MFNSMLEIIFSSKAEYVMPAGDGVSFRLATGEVGTVEKNICNGCWDVYISGDFVYEIETELDPILNHSSNKELFNTYKYLNTLNFNTFQDKSRIFLDVIKVSTENVLLNSNLALEGHAKIGMYEVIYKDKKKFLISLN